MPQPRLLRFAAVVSNASAVALLAVGALAVGCAPTQTTWLPGEDPAREVQPGDFVAHQAAAPRPARVSDEVLVDPAVSQTETAQASGAPTIPPAVAVDVAPPSDSSVSDVEVVLTSSNDAGVVNAPPSPSAPVERPVPVDGMVGQINGRPVFADDVLSELEPALRALGQRESPRGFRDEARQQIDEMVRSRVMNALILSEAERALTDQEWNGVRFMVDKRRQELLRQHGQGSLAVAERNLRALTGRSLEETLERFRDGLITDTYVGRNFRSRVNVSRRDIERYYREHPEQFNPEPVRDLTLIVAADTEAAAQVEAALGEGQAFGDVAAGPLNELAGGGTMTGIAGDAPFGFAPVNEAVATLGADAWAGPIDAGDGRFWFVRVDRVEQGPVLSFEDAQGLIETALGEQQFSVLTNQFRSRLLGEGNFTRPEQMVDALVEIAVNRYARR